MLPALSNWTKNWRATAAGVLLASLIATAASAADHPVSSDAQLRAALNPSGGAQDGDTITLANDITLQGDLPVVQRSVKLVGKNFALLGQGKYRGLFVYAGTVQISDLTIKDTRAQGGNGGNGLNTGAGGGGGELGWAERCSCAQTRSSPSPTSMCREVRRREATGERRTVGFSSTRAAAAAA
jgi:hypothetical protein